MIRCFRLQEDAKSVDADRTMRAVPRLLGLITEFANGSFAAPGDMIPGGLEILLWTTMKRLLASCLP